jgi:hypothetical protein
MLFCCLPLASLSDFAIVQVPTSPVFPFNEVLSSGSNVTFRIPRGVSYHIVFHELPAASVVVSQDLGDGATKQLRYTDADVPRFLSIILTPLIECLSVTAISSGRLSFTLFQVTCRGNVFVTNQIAARFSFWGRFPEFPCASRSDVCIFFNATHLYRVTSGYPGRIASSDLLKDTQAALSGPSVLVLTGVPCATEFNVSIDSDRQLSDPPIEHFVPDPLFVRDVPSMHPDGPATRNGGGNRSIYAAAAVVGLIVTVACWPIARAFYRHIPQTPHPAEKPGGQRAEERPPLNVAPVIVVVAQGEEEEQDTEQAIVANVPDPYGMCPRHSCQGAVATEGEEDVPESPYDAAAGLY